MINSEIEKELQKEIQFNIEKEKLEDTIIIINNEINKLINSRKNIIDHITTHRKDDVEEYRKDEDQVAEYFDHERYILEEQFRFIDRRLKELTILASSPYFGKVGFIEDNSIDEEYIYIGRFGLTPKDTYEPIVIDWRSPVAALFYTGKPGEASYNAPAGEIKVNILGKRQLIVKRGKLLGLFDSALDIKDEILQMVLSSNSSDKLKDIVMTIQEEQDNLIRQPHNKTIVVDGVAGSGKTTIALHRIAYLLYNYRNILQDRVLILGPNNIFMEYISMVLPSLGEVGVKQSTFVDFAMSLIDIDEIMGLKEYMEKVIQEDEEFIEKIKYKGSYRYLKELDLFLEHTNNNYFKVEDVIFFNNVILTKEEIEEMFDKHFKTMPLFKRSKRIKRVIYTKIRDARDERVREIEKNYKETLAKMTQEELNAHGSQLEFQRRINIRNVISEVMETKKRLDWLKNDDVVDMYIEFNKDKYLTVDDLAPILYLKINLEGLTYKDDIRHVVIDEAQDYNLLQLIVIKELTKCKHFTIVGDRNQRLIPYEDKIAMEYLEEYMELENVERYPLNKSYRSTQEIMKYANTYLGENEIIPLVRKGEEVIVEDIYEEEKLQERLLSSIKEFKDKGLETIAVICKNNDTTQYISKLIKGKMYIKTIDREDAIYTSGEIVISSYLAKGLEFDGVIIIDDNFTNYSKMMYVMATRALHNLRVLKLKY
ncbi:AAA family ATPase [Clostridium sp. MSJ-11]|uniref:AAA family ATPase n=1 Tax=Clostridium mobile TaxID=2841512 RepID=A0ABS6EKS4_9CLOT|nr:UvrD-helicase domain-containing protein [Clostridium mobile]MBU5485276.1 AAA family ATPase [Clostridium mobile]